jgi:hypothetical protein
MLSSLIQVVPMNIFAGCKNSPQTLKCDGEKMKKIFRRLAFGVMLISIPLFLVRCDGGKEQSETKPVDAKKEAAVKKEAAPKSQSKSMLPEKLLNLGITDEQKAQCEAAYQEIFTPEILSQRKQMYKKLREMEKDSQEYMNFKKEIVEKFKPYNIQFNKTLRMILTKEQQEQYFPKKVAQK